MIINTKMLDYVLKIVDIAHSLIIVRSTDW